jgi:hypothetical protein
MIDAKELRIGNWVHHKDNWSYRQPKQDFKEFGTIQIAAYIKTDAKFATFTSLIGFATLGAGLWLAGRQAANTKFPFWLNFGFDPQTQMKNSIETAIKMIKAED